MRPVAIQYGFGVNYFGRLAAMNLAQMEKGDTGFKFMGITLL